MKTRYKTGAALRVVLVLTALVGSLVPATVSLGDTFTLFGTQGTGGAPDSGGGNQNLSGTNLSLTLPTFNDINLNIVHSEGSLAVPLGMATARTHACSGGGPGFSGFGTSETRANTNLTFRVESDTLPLNTIVPVTFAFGIRGRVTAAVKNQVDFSSADTSVAGSVYLGLIGAGQILSREGAAIQYSSVVNPQTSGTLAVLDDEDMITFNAPVGGVLQVITSLRSFSQSLSSGIPGVDGDSQGALLWGLSAGSDVRLLSLADPGLAVPPASGATSDTAAAALPPRVIPEPGAFMALASALVIACQRGARRQRRTTRA